MKTSLLIAALFVTTTLRAQDAQPPSPPSTETKGPVDTKQPDSKPKKDKKNTGCSSLPPDQQARFKLPPKVQEALDKQRAEIARRTGISLPPPPPPKPLPPCPPPAAPVKQ